MEKTFKYWDTSLVRNTIHTMITLLTRSILLVVDTVWQLCSCTLVMWEKVGKLCSPMPRLVAVQGYAPLAILYVISAKCLARILFFDWGNTIRFWLLVFLVSWSHLGFMQEPSRRKAAHIEEDLSECAKKGVAGKLVTCSMGRLGRAWSDRQQICYVQAQSSLQYTWA